MANTFKLKTKADVGVTTVGIYTATAPVTATVVIGVTLANTTGQSINVGVGISRGVNGDDIKVMNDIPLPQGSSIEFMQGNKVVLEQNDTVTAVSDTNNSLDVALTIMEITP
tara:strand:+ start:55 stop:390 length:336 start_codon:yes stop_codon:yes gene_type:complete